MPEAVVSAVLCDLRCARVSHSMHDAACGGVAGLRGGVHENKVATQATRQEQETGERQKRHRRSRGAGRQAPTPRTTPSYRFVLRLRPPLHNISRVHKIQIQIPPAGSQRIQRGRPTHTSHMLAFAIRHFCGDDIDTTRIFCLLRKIKIAFCAAFAFSLSLKINATHHRGGGPQVLGNWYIYRYYARRETPVTRHPAVAGS